jgi:hypothetical protein
MVDGMSMTAVTHRVLDGSGKFVAEYDNEFYARAVAKIINGMTEEICYRSAIIQPDKNAKRKSAVAKSGDVFFVICKPESCSKYVHSVFTGEAAAKKQLSEILEDEDDAVEVCIEKHTLETPPTRCVRNVYALTETVDYGTVGEYNIRGVYTSRSGVMNAAMTECGDRREILSWRDGSSSMAEKLLFYRNGFTGIGFSRYYVTRD